MNSNQLESALKDVLKSYWRQRAALKIYYQQTESKILKSQRIEYTGIPEVGTASAFLCSETVEDALTAIESYFSHRLAPDLFMAVLSHFETFLGESIRLKRGNSNGTLGQLQAEVERLYNQWCGFAELS